MPDAAPAAPKSRRVSPDFSALRALLPYATRLKGRIALAFLALAGASGATLAVPLAVRRMIDEGFAAGVSGSIDAQFLGLMAVAGALALASASRYYLVTTIGERVVADLRADVFAHLTRLDAAFFDGEKTGELVSRLSADTTQMKAAFGASASVALRNLFMFAGALALMVWTSPGLSLWTLAAIPLIVLPLVAFGRSVRGRARAAQDRLADASAFAAETLGATRVMQAFGAERATAARYAAAAEGAYGAARDATVVRAALTAVVIFISGGSVVAILWLGARDVVAGRMSGGVLTQFMLYAVLAASALGELSQVWSEISAAAGAAGRIGELLAKRPAVAPPASPRALPSPARGEIAFEDVRFAYPSRPDLPSLNGVSFRVAPGERVAIVGPSGAGKSTLFQLLERFYDPTSGTVRLDGEDVAKVDPAELRARFALAPQDPTVFGMSVADNVRYGRPDAPFEAVTEAARKAQADGFARALPKGYDTQVGERGVALSGGERQRLAIARAVLRDAPVLLLDEATSALDAESEAAVQRGLDALMEGRTSLVIAHRLATVLKADRILVMDAGKIVEQGTHSDLARAGGLYARLASLQFDAAANAAE